MPKGVTTAMSAKAPASTGAGKGGKGGKSFYSEQMKDRMSGLLVLFCAKHFGIDKYSINIAHAIEASDERRQIEEKKGVSDIAEMHSLTLLEQVCQQFKDGDLDDSLEEFEQTLPLNASAQGSNEASAEEEEEGEYDGEAEVLAFETGLTSEVTVDDAAGLPFAPIDLAAMQRDFKRMQQQLLEHQRLYQVGVSQARTANSFTDDFTNRTAAEQAQLKRKVENLEESVRHLTSERLEHKRIIRELLLLMHQQNAGVSPLTGEPIDPISHPLDEGRLHVPHDRQIKALVLACDNAFKLKTHDIDELADLLCLSKKCNATPQHKSSVRQAWTQRCFAIDFWNDLAKYREIFWAAYQYTIGNAYGHRQPKHLLMPPRGIMRDVAAYGHSRRVKPPGNGSMPYRGKPPGLDMNAGPTVPLGALSAHAQQLALAPSPRPDRGSANTTPTSLFNHCTLASSPTARQLQASVASDGAGVPIERRHRRGGTGVGRPRSPCAPSDDDEEEMTQPQCAPRAVNRRGGRPLGVVVASAAEAVATTARPGKRSAGRYAGEDFAMHKESDEDEGEDDLSLSDSDSDAARNVKPRSQLGNTAARRGQKNEEAIKEEKEELKRQHQAQSNERRYAFGAAGYHELAVGAVAMRQGLMSADERLEQQNASAAADAAEAEASAPPTRTSFDGLETLAPHAEARKKKLEQTAVVRPLLPASR